MSKIAQLIGNDPRFAQCRLFDKAILRSVAVSEDGYIGFIKITGSFFQKQELSVFHINDVISINLAGQPKVLYELQITINDFNNPQIVIPLYRKPEGGGFILIPIIMMFLDNWRKAEAEIKELMALLENMLYTRQSNQEPGQATQHTSDADELAKYKKLLDDGAITQKEFDAKKKQILDL